MTEIKVNRFLISLLLIIGHITVSQTQTIWENENI